jgi:acetyl-CoA carboxylase biotin carboxyl carrier protein
LETENPKNPEQELAAPALTQVDFLRELGQIVRAENLSELEIESAGVRVTLKAPEPSPAPGAPGVLPAPAETLPATTVPPAFAPHAGSTPGAPDDSLLTIVSPMIGVFYRAPSPSDPNFVEVGDVVEIGQTVALVEAMKVFNEITAEVAGTVIEIKAQTAELVETGQVLMTIRP